MHLLVFRRMFSWYLINKGQYSHARFGYIHWQDKESMTDSLHRFLGLFLLQSAPFFTPQSHCSYMVLWWVLAVPNELIIRPGKKNF
ncbi:hypothetical protein V6Z12_A03G130200 [Gossypium hirsutum]